MVVLFYLGIYLLIGLIIHLVAFRYDFLGEYRVLTEGSAARLPLLIFWPATVTVAMGYGVGALLSALEMAVLPSEKPSKLSEEKTNGNT